MMLRPLSVCEKWARGDIASRYGVENADSGRFCTYAASVWGVLRACIQNYLMQHFCAPQIGSNLSTITVAALRSGLELMPAGKRQDHLRAGIQGIEAAFKGRVLSLDLPAAIEFGTIVATRDVNDFHGTGVRLIYPWG
jgi:hypothetical protein